MSIAEKILFWIAAAAYIVCIILHAYRFIFRREQVIKWEKYFIYPGLAANIGAIVFRTVQSGYLPLAFKYEGALIVAASTIAGFILWRRKTSLVDQLGVVCFPFVVLILLVGYASSPDIKPLTAAYISRWLTIHALFTILGSVCFIFALAASILYLLKDSGRENLIPSTLANIPEKEVLGDLNFRLILFGFICWSVMIISGALWAKDLWGSYWSWDPVETWSLVSWLLWGTYIHLYFIRGWKGRRLAWICILSFVINIISIWGIEMVTPDTYHNLQQIISPRDRQ